jgi:hypothetical protein
MAEWDADKGPSDEQVNDALRVLRAEYWSSIRGSAKALADEIRKGDLAPEDVEDRLHEDADGSYWTIYTHANYRAVMCSDHDPWEDVADAGQTLDSGAANGQPCAIIAYYCVRHDTREQLEAELGCAPEDWTPEETAEGVVAIGR